MSPGGACGKRWQGQPVRASSGFSYVVVMSIVNLDFTIVYAYWFILHRKGKSNISINQKNCTFFLNHHEEKPRRRAGGAGGTGVTGEAGEAGEAGGTGLDCREWAAVQFVQASRNSGGPACPGVKKSRRPCERVACFLVANSNSLKALKPDYFITLTALVVPSV